MQKDSISFVVTYRIRQTIIMVLLATMILTYYWGLFFQAPTIIKVLYSMLIWCALFVFPYQLINDNTFSKTTNVFLKVLIVMGIVQTIRSALSSDPLLHAFGNKWLTLFFNEYSMFLLIPPIFVYLGNRDEGLFFLKNSTLTYLLIGIAFLLLLKFPLAGMSIFVGVFYPYVDKKYKILIVIAIAEAFLSGIIAVRTNFIIIFFTFSSYFLVYKVKRKLITKSFCVFFTIAPLFLVFSILTMGQSGESILNKVLEMAASNSGDENMAVDTRSMLYFEMAQDLTVNESWVLGKGAYTHYYSEYFSTQIEGDNSDRILCEVPFLNYLMHGGIMYVFFYFGLLLMGVYKGLKSNNKFVQSIAIVAIGWYFISFIGDINGCKLFHLGFFLLLGICLSPHWCNRTDDEIEEFFKGIQ